MQRYLGVISNWVKTYASFKMLILFMLGFSSGLPIALVMSTLQAWYKHYDADIVTIGSLSLLSIPFTYKFLWAPLLDHFTILKIDLRKGWILAMQIGIVACLLQISTITPDSTYKVYFLGFIFNFKGILLFAVLLAIFAATQDIAIDAYRTEILSSKERGLGTAISVEGYRIGMLASGGFALIIADKYNFNVAYQVMSILMLIGAVGAYFGPKTNHKIKKETNVISDIKSSFLDFLKSKNAILFILFLITYKLGDVFSHALSTPFLKDLGFSFTEIGMINKTVGVIATIFGIMFGGVIMTKLGLYRSLIIFGILSAVTNLNYMILALVGKNIYLALFAFFTESLCGGMGTAALVATIMSLCNKEYAATQFALLSSITSIGRVYFGPIAGFLQLYVGWADYFLSSAFIAIPGLILVRFLKDDLYRIDQDEINEHYQQEKPTFTGELQGTR